ncbi:MAG: hypothetical protein ACJA11_002582 [Glaciecola sp.]|jgi:hypothetical protein
MAFKGKFAFVTAMHNSAKKPLIAKRRSVLTDATLGLGARIVRF